MALHNTACFSSILIITCLMIATTTNGKSNELVMLCAGTVDPLLCIEALGGDIGASLEGAAEVGFQTVGIGAISSRDMFHRIVTSPKTSSLFKELAGKCEQKYDYIYKDLVVPGHEAARVGRWEDVKSPVNQIPLVVDDCENLWDNEVSPAHEDCMKIQVAAQAIVEIAKVRTE